jgi:hypothetical protein
MAALTQYQDQVSFAKRWIKSGDITEAGTWQQGLAWGKMWGGTVCGYHVQLKTIGNGPMMRAGSFAVRAV